MTGLEEVRIQFAPAPSKTNRRDGWTEARQRAFVAALDRCGSVTAARRVGRPVRGDGKVPDSVNKVNQTAAKARKSALLPCGGATANPRDRACLETYFPFSAPVAARFALSPLRSPPVRLPPAGRQPKGRG